MTRPTWARWLAFTDPRPALDYGKRVAIYPPGTSFADALAAETVKQNTAGFTIVAGSASLLADYFVRSTSDTLLDGEDTNDQDHGWRDTPVVVGSTCLQYRLAGPGIHT